MLVVENNSKIKPKSLKNQKPAIIILDVDILGCNQTLSPCMQIVALPSITKEGQEKIRFFLKIWSKTF